MLAHIASANEPDLVRLRDVICHQVETRGDAPDGTPARWAVGDSGKSFGVCQIQYGTAVLAGGLDPKHEGFPALGDALRSRQIALEILTWCSKPHRLGHKMLPARLTIRGLAACYNGPAMDYPLPAERLMERSQAEDWPDKKLAAYLALRLYTDRVQEAYNAQQKTEASASR